MSRESTRELETVRWVGDNRAQEEHDLEGDVSQLLCGAYIRKCIEGKQ